MDESAAKLKMEITSKPQHLDEIDRKILQLEMERLSLAKVGSQHSFSHLSSVLRNHGPPAACCDGRLLWAQDVSQEARLGASLPIFQHFQYSPIFASW